MLVETLAPDDIIGDITAGLEAWCEQFNAFSEVFFVYLKISFIFILLVIGLLTIYRWRGFWRALKFKDLFSDKEEQKELSEKVKEPHVILGLFYISMAVGIAFGYLTYFLLLVLEPLPDQFVYGFINFSGFIDDDIMIRLSDLSLIQAPHERTMYYAMAYTSFFGFVDIILGMRFIIISSNKSHTTSFKLFFSGLFICTFFGFTTFMPLFL